MSKSDKLDITSSVEGGIVILRVALYAEFAFEGDTHGLGKKLIGAYESVRKEATSCAVVLDATKIGGAFLVCALFELHEVVCKKGGGQLLCVNYPKDYIHSLTSLGVDALEGFATFDNLEDATASVAA